MKLKVIRFSSQKDSSRGLLLITVIRGNIFQRDKIICLTFSGRL